MKKIITFAIILSLFASCGGDMNHSSKNENIALEEQLAILDGDNTPDPNDIKVIRIKTLLGDLSELYSEPQDSIAEWTSKAQGVLHEKGILETNLNILEEMNKSGKIENTPYRDAITLYALIRSSGLK
ncbi:hypothetical protein J5U18_09805 [Sphingobacteriaceae bacterium WQ 2009]|uniref:Lipoprotein n=1 Tax=Rhinopithecimicrobium faecis TaxID=2820698 RepID=A0A8T4HEV4_9SPHI|nr:hypothetical protein [Sphingobacteriaceae bacterium WQ 2009]